MKAAVYCASRSIYEDLIPAAKSLLLNSDVEKIYFCIEDDVFPYEIPDCIETINVSSQKFFHPSGPNYARRWTWMTMMRTALTKILPDLDKVLSLDVDTLAVKDVSDLWEIDLGDNYLAAVREPRKSKDRLYVNFGVVLFNLKLLRETGKDNEIINALNTRPYEFCEQDCVPELCEGKILTIDGGYNTCDWTEPTFDPKIIHFAAGSNRDQRWLLNKFRGIPWSEIR